MGTGDRERAAVESTPCSLSADDIEPHIHGLPATRATVGTLPHPEDLPALRAWVVDAIPSKSVQRRALERIGQSAEIDAVSGHMGLQSAARPRTPVSKARRHVNARVARNGGVGA